MGDVGPKGGGDWGVKVKYGKSQKIFKGSESKVQKVLKKLKKVKVK